MSSVIFDDQLHLFNTFRRSILLVTPNESSFESVEEVPDYALEVRVQHTSTSTMYY